MHVVSFFFFFLFFSDKNATQLTCYEILRGKCPNGTIGQQVCDVKATPRKTYRNICRALHKRCKKQDDTCYDVEVSCKMYKGKNLILGWYLELIWNWKLYDCTKGPRRLTCTLWNLRKYVIKGLFCRVYNHGKWEYHVYIKAHKTNLIFTIEDFRWHIVVDLLKRLLIYSLIQNELRKS